MSSNSDSTSKPKQRFGRRKREEKPKRTLQQKIISNLIMIGFAFVLYYILQWQIVKSFVVPSGSMLPTLKIGQRIIADRLTMNWTDPARGDIVVFRPPLNYQQGCSGVKLNLLNQAGVPVAGIPVPGGSACSTVATKKNTKQYFVKRLVAKPGDTFRIVRGKGIYVNGKLQGGKYKHACNSTSAQKLCNYPAPIKLGKNQYYMVGDNREGSWDSRAWGPIDRSWIVGPVFWTFWPIDRIGPL